MATPWLRFGSFALCLEQLPGLLERGGLLIPLVRRLILETSTHDIVVTEQEQTAFYQRFLRNQNISSRDQLDAWLSANKLTEAQASLNALEALRIERLKQNMFGEQVERVFFETKDSRDRVVYSLLRVRDQAAAQELYLRLQDGDATFTDLSGKHSGGPERETGGLIGPVVMARLHPQLAEVLRISSLNQLWPPMLVDGWWVIIRLDKKLSAELDDPMRSSIRNELFDQWLQAQVDQFMAAYFKATSEGAVDAPEA